MAPAETELLREAGAGAGAIAGRSARKVALSSLASSLLVAPSGRAILDRVSPQTVRTATFKKAISQRSYLSPSDLENSQVLSVIFSFNISVFFTSYF